MIFRFATVVVGSDPSFRRCMDQLPKRMIHGQNPVVTPANKTNLAKFEAASRKDEPSRNGMGRYTLRLLPFSLTQSLCNTLKLLSCCCDCLELTSSARIGNCAFISDGSGDNQNHGPRTQGPPGQNMQQGMPPQGMMGGNMVNIPPRGFPPGGPRGPMPGGPVQMQRPVGLPGMGPGNPLQAMQQGSATADTLYFSNFLKLMSVNVSGMARPGMQMPPGMQGPMGGPPGMVCCVVTTEELHVV